MTDVTYAAGWYPDTNEIGTERYYDGMAWTAQTRPVTAATTTTPVSDTAAKRPWYKRKALIIPVSLVGGIIVLSGVISGLTPDAPTGRPPIDSASSSQRDDESVVEEEQVDTTVEIPDVVGMTIAEAKVALTAVSITLDLPADVKDDWIISEQSVPGGARIEPGDPLSISAAAPKPVLTLAQENVIRQAQSYLSHSAFSREGLVGQLEYEGYSNADAQFGADNAGADWNAEAAEQAASYLSHSSFSRQGLYDQMAYEEFTPQQIEFALKAVGY